MMLGRWTRIVLRFRWAVLALWLVVLLLGGFASTRLSSLLSNTFTVPGTDSERARTILQEHFGDRSDGEFLVVYRIRDGTAGVRPKLEHSLRQAAKAVPTGQPTALRFPGHRAGRQQGGQHPYRVRGPEDGLGQREVAQVDD